MWNRRLIRLDPRQRRPEPGAFFFSSASSKCILTQIKANSCGKDAAFQEKDGMTQSARTLERHVAGGPVRAAPVRSSARAPAGTRWSIACVNRLEGAADHHRRPQRATSLPARPHAGRGGAEAGGLHREQTTDWLPAGSRLHPNTPPVDAEAQTVDHRGGRTLDYDFLVWPRA
jgi:hypothetical protein